MSVTASAGFQVWHIKGRANLCLLLPTLWFSYKLFGFVPVLPTPQSSYYHYKMNVESQDRGPGTCRFLAVLDQAGLKIFHKVRKNQEHLTGLAICDGDFNGT